MKNAPVEKSLREGEQGSALKIKDFFSVVRGLSSFERLRIVPSLVRLVLNNNDRKLVSGSGPYGDYFYGGENPVFAERLDFWDMRQFDTKPVVSSIIEHGIITDADPQSSKLLRKLVSKVAVKFDFDVFWLDKAYWTASERGANLVLLSNHLSHLDAPMIDLAFREKGYAPRFVCGAFMFYNRHVRPFTRAFDTIFVFGPKDQKDLLKNLLSQSEGREEKREIIALMESFNAKVRDAMAERRPRSKTREVIVLFPYAGRANETSGCKEEGIPPGMAAMLTDVRNDFLTMGMFGQRDAVPGGAGWNIISNFSNMAHVRPTIVFWDRFSGGERSIQSIHASMLSVASLGLKRYAETKKST